MQLTSALRESGKTFVSASTLPITVVRKFSVARRYDSTHHEANFKEIGCDAHQYMNLAEKVEIQRCHSVVIRNARKEIHENQLTVPLATIPGFLVRRSFLFRAALDKYDGRCPATGDSCIGTSVPSRRHETVETVHTVMTSIDHRSILLLRSRPNSDVAHWCRISESRIGI